MASEEKDRSNVNGTASAPKYTATGTKVDSQPGHEWHKPSPELVQAYDKAAAEPRNQAMRMEALHLRAAQLHFVYAEHMMRLGDAVDALRFYRYAAAKAGPNAAAGAVLAVAYVIGRFHDVSKMRTLVRPVPADYKAAAAIWAKKLPKLTGEALVHAGVHLGGALHSLGYARAAVVQWKRMIALKDAPDMGRALCMLEAAKAYFAGDGDLPVDEKQALTLAEEAYKLLPREGIATLSNLLMHGRDVYDLKRAIQINTDALESKDPSIKHEAALRLCKIYGMGYGVAPQPKKVKELVDAMPDASQCSQHWSAVVWGAAADKNVQRKMITMYADFEMPDVRVLDGVAKYNYGLALLKGLYGIPKDVPAAVEWLKKAAALNFVHAKALLALQPNGATDQPPVIRKEGMLSKQGAVVKNWKLRKFTLDQYAISYGAPKDKKSIRQLPLAGMRLGYSTTAECAKPFAFTLVPLIDEENRGAFICVAANAAERDEWITAITAARDLATWGHVYPHEGKGPVNHEDPAAIQCYEQSLAAIFGPAGLDEAYAQAIGPMFTEAMLTEKDRADIVKGLAAAKGLGLTFQYPELRAAGAPPLPSEQPYTSPLHAHALYLVTKTRRVCSNCQKEISETYQCANCDFDVCAQCLDGSRAPVTATAAAGAVTPPAAT